MNESKSIALVTGASVGIGEAIARELAASGFNLVLMARREEKLNELAEHLRSEHNTECHIIAADVNDHERVVAAISRLPNNFSSIEVLVNNAGLALGTEPTQSADWSDWLLMIQTNCMALAHLTHLVLPGMLERKRGHVINIGSIAGNYAYKGGNVYGATKAFVDQFSANLRTDVLGTPIRVTNLVPGLLEGTEFSVVRMHGDQNRANSVYAGLEALQAEDVAEAVRWVVSLPRRVNINRLELMAISQSAGGLAFKAIEEQLRRNSMHNLNPKKLLNSKWTAVKPSHKEKHFMVVEVEFAEDQSVESCTIEAVFSKRQQAIKWADLKDTEHWRQGWVQTNCPYWI